MSIKRPIASLAVCLTCALFPLSAAVIDPAGDILATYTGPSSAALDALAASVVYDPTASTFTFSATLAGSPASAPAGALYVFGLNRGAGTQRFVAGTPSIGAGI